MSRTYNGGELQGEVRSTHLSSKHFPPPPLLCLLLPLPAEPWTTSASIPQAPLLGMGGQGAGCSCQRVELICSEPASRQHRASQTALSLQD